MVHRRRLGFAAMYLCLGLIALPAMASTGKPVPAKLCRGLFIVPVTWKEETLQFVLDTGSTHWAADPDGIERVRGKRYASGKKVTLRKGEAGPLKINRLRVRIHELDHLALALGHEIDGIMGMDTFDGLLLTLDYPAEEVRVGDGALPEIDGQEIFRDYGKSRPFVRFEIGDVAVPVLLDSGFTGRLKLHEDDPVSWKSEPTMVNVSVRYSEIKLDYAGRLSETFRLGPLTLVEPITTLTDETRLAGAELLKHMQLTFDRAGRRIRMRTSGDSRIHSEPYRSLGLGLRPRRNGLEVTGVFEDTPAERAGVKRGDLLTHVDGEFVHDRDCASIEETATGPQLLTLQRQGKAYEVEVQQAVLVP